MQPSVDVIIIPGAQNDASGRLSEMAVERARGALREHARRPGAKLLLTGGYGHFNHAEQPHAHYLTLYLIGQGISPDDLLPFAESWSTVEDAVLCRRILDGLKLGSICVVTSEVHMPRVRLIFEHFFDPAMLTFTATPYGVSEADLREYQRHEAEAMRVIQEQGGVKYEGRLYTR